MSENANISQERRKALINPFLRDVSYMFNIEAQPVFESKLDELHEMFKSMGCHVRQLNTDRMCILSVSKQNIGILMTPRILSIRVEAVEYVNSDVEQEFLLPFISKYNDIVEVNTIDTIVISKNYTFALQRSNEIAKKVSIEQYCQSLFSQKFLSEHTNKGVFKKLKNINVSAKYTPFMSEDSLRVELQVGGVDFGECAANTLGDRLKNASDAIHSIWCYAMSDEMQDVLNDEKEGKEK